MPVYIIGCLSNPPRQAAATRNCPPGPGPKDRLGIFAGGRPGCRWAPADEAPGLHVPVVPVSVDLP